MKLGARFAYWWEGAAEDGGARPCFKIPVESQDGIGYSDVFLETLHERGFRVPNYPSYERWKKSQERRKTNAHCTPCDRNFRTKADLAHHNMIFARFAHPGLYRKTGVAIMLLLCALWVPASAWWEFPRNPDRFPSIGINVSNTDLSGTHNETDQPSTPLTRTTASPISESIYALGGDIRLPINNIMTLSFSLESVDRDLHFTRPQNVYREDDRLNGIRYGFGFRLYLAR